MDALSFKYILLLSGSLENFSKKGNNLYNFRCNLCGDSKRNRRKSRAYLYEKENETWFKCHKCGFSTHFDQFLKNQDHFLYNEYIREKIYSTQDETIPLIEKKEISKITYDTSNFGELYSINKLPHFDPLKKYIINRKIPEFAHDILFKCLEFKKFTNSILPGKFSEKALRFEEERFIIPFFTEQKKVFAFSGRTLDPNNDLRYININLDDNIVKLYGMERWNKTKKTYVVEGPLDSLFLPNSLATAGNKMPSALRGFNKDNFVLIYDNEKRSITTREKIKEAIDEKYNVCIWPSSIEEKDINQMILKGKDANEILSIIDNNTFSGLQAQVKLASYKV